MESVPRWHPTLSRPGVVAVVVVLLAVGVAAVARLRPDPAAEPGLRIAVVRLLERDATLAPTTDPRARAEQAAAVGELWEHAAQAPRLAALDAASTRAVDRRPVRLTVTRWQQVGATASSGVVVMDAGLDRQRVDGTWDDGAIRTWRIDLHRGDPVGPTRGWRLVAVSIS